MVLPGIAGLSLIFHYVMERLNWIDRADGQGEYGASWYETCFGNWGTPVLADTFVCVKLFWKWKSIHVWLAVLNLIVSPEKIYC